MATYSGGDPMRQVPSSTGPKGGYPQARWRYENARNSYSNRSDDPTSASADPEPNICETFSEDSFGFRTGRSTHGAVRRSRDHIAAGYRWVVDLDLEKFFDQVNHDVLMARIARRVDDKRTLLLIRRYSGYRNGQHENIFPVNGHSSP